jgi:hypothetical protein
MIERARSVLETGLPWGILGLMTAGALGGTVNEGIQRLIQQNGAVLLLVAIAVQYMPRAIDAQRAQASAITDLAASVREATNKDDVKHEQIQIGIQMILDRFDNLECRSKPCSVADQPAHRLAATQASGEGRGGNS